MLNKLLHNMAKLLRMKAREKGLEEIQQKIDAFFSDPKAQSPFNLPDWMVMIMSNQEALDEKLDEILYQVSSIEGRLQNK